MPYTCPAVESVDGRPSHRCRHLQRSAEDGRLQWCALPTSPRTFDQRFSPRSMNPHTLPHYGVFVESEDGGSIIISGACSSLLRAPMIAQI